MENKFIIPSAFIIVVDDVGWWCGNDHRYKNGPSRSGIERRHTIKDYEAIIEIGKKMGMRIKCGFVIGEWDRTNILAEVRNSNKYGKLWDNASFLNKEEADEVVDLINSNSEYIELALHGVMHMFWDDEGNFKPAEFFQRDEDSGKTIMTDKDVVREHLDAFFEIYGQNGFKAEVESFIPPCFIYEYNPGEDGMSRILSQYGIKYISTIFNQTDRDEVVLVENGIITVDRTVDLTPWYGVDLEVPDIIKRSYYGMHWPNFLHHDPEKNHLPVKRWIGYFEGYKGKPDILVAKNNEEASLQALYKRHVRIGEKENFLTFDFSEIDKLEVKEPKDYFYINVSKGFKLRGEGSLGAKIVKTYSDYETCRIKRKKPYESFGKVHIERTKL